MALVVNQIPVGPMSNMVYLAVDPTTRDAAVVDSGWETGPIEKAVAESGARVKYIVATHGHFDHMSTMGELAGKVGGKLVAHENSTAECDLRVRDGDVLEVGRAALKILHTPGHTEDSVCIYGGREVFTGDTLFVGTIGKFDREEASAMYSSLYDVIFNLPPETVIYPGHDYGEVRSRTLREERVSNPYLMARNVREFISAFA
ncbi:MAG: MBL fold metallo-hydrolase [Nitrososphaerota archaeon]|nr:MBL fold metallo-hydrolase [Nitrososphaerota archaeon]